MTQKLLLADDSITMQRLVSLTFADENIEVISVGDGASVARRVKEIRPDIILVDVFLPGKNGYEICEMVKSDPQLQHVPVLLLVGTFEPLDPNEARRVNADDHLTKPFESAILVQKVKSLLTGVSAPPTPSPADTATTAPKTTEPATGAKAPLAGTEEVATHAVAAADRPPKGPAVIVEAPAESAPAGFPAEAHEPPTVAAPTDSPVATPPVDASRPDTQWKPAPVAQPFPVGVAAGNHHAPDDAMDNLLELDLDVSAADQDRNSFLTSPLLDIYTEPSPESLELESVPLDGSTAVEADLLGVSEHSVAPVEPAAPTPVPVSVAPPVAVSSPPVAPAPAVGEAVPDAWIEAVAQRVVQKLSDSVIREIAWEVVPELSELIIREQVKQSKSPKSS